VTVSRHMTGQSYVPGYSKYVCHAHAPREHNIIFMPTVVVDKLHSITFLWRNVNWNKHHRNFGDTGVAKQNNQRISPVTCQRVIWLAENSNQVRANGTGLIL